MAFITVSGEPGCRHEELARVAAQRLECELVTEPDLAKMIAAEFGDSIRIPDLAWRPLTVSILATLGTERHVVVCSTGAELLSGHLGAAMLRLHVVAPESVRLGNLMQDSRLNRADAKARLRELEAERAVIRKRRFGQKISRPTDFDLVLNACRLGPSEMVDLLEAAVKSQGLLDAGPLAAAAAAEVQFKVRLQLARFGMAPPKRPNHPPRMPRSRATARILDTPANKYSPTCWTSMESRGTTSLAASPCNGTKTERLPKPSRPIFTCLSSTSM